MKRILIPVDSSYNSSNAIDFAIKFFKREACEFYFLNTYSYDVRGMDALSLLQSDDDWFELPKLESQKILGFLVKKYTKDNKNEMHSYTAISECADLVDGIQKSIEELKIDFLLFSGKKKDETSSDRYSRNTELIIKGIRECPVIIVPENAHLKKNQEFVLASSFEVGLPIKELKNWGKLLRLVKGKGRIIAFNKSSDMTSVQKINLSQTLMRLYNISGSVLPIHYLNSEEEIKQFTQRHSDCIISIADKKPDIWRKLGIKNSEIVNLGPLHYTPLIALHS
ncbi:universal stress protein [Dokdonia genika]|uniref:Universal stress protein n=1 Tax=Dokdonia genika TaxID=308113 RepID=A0ABV9L8F4_9FLAO